MRLRTFNRAIYYFKKVVNVFFLSIKKNSQLLIRYNFNVNKISSHKCMYHFMIELFRPMTFNLSRNSFQKNNEEEKKNRKSVSSQGRKKVISYFWLHARRTGRAFE